MHAPFFLRPTTTTTALSRVVVVLATQLRAANIQPACNASVLRAVLASAAASVDTTQGVVSEADEAKLFPLPPSRTATTGGDPHVAPPAAGSPASKNAPWRPQSVVAEHSKQPPPPAQAPSAAGAQQAREDGSPPKQLPVQLTAADSTNERDREAAKQREQMAVQMAAADAAMAMPSPTTTDGDNVSFTSPGSVGETVAPSQPSLLQRPGLVASSTSNSPGNAASSSAISPGDDDIDAVVVDMLHNLGKASPLAIDLWRMRDGVKGVPVRVIDTLPSHLAAQHNGQAATIRKQRLQIKV